MEGPGKGRSDDAIAGRFLTVALPPSRCSRHNGKPHPILNQPVPSSDEREGRNLTREGRFCGTGHRIGPRLGSGSLENAEGLQRIVGPSLAGCSAGPTRVGRECCKEALAPLDHRCKFQSDHKCPRPGRCEPGTHTTFRAGVDERSCGPQHPQRGGPAKSMKVFRDDPIALLSAGIECGVSAPSRGSGMNSL
jgi:hypothetical protein